MNLAINLNVFINKKSKRKVTRPHIFTLHSNFLRWLRNSETIKCTGYYPHQMSKMTTVVMVRRDCFIFLSKKIPGQLLDCYKFTLHANICPLSQNISFSEAIQKASDGSQELGSI